MSPMNGGRSPWPCSICVSRFSQLPVSSADVSAWLPSSSIVCLPFGVETSALPSRSM